MFSSWNRRKRTLAAIIVASIFLTTLLGTGLLLSDDGLKTQLQLRNQAPSLEHLFGTDWLGRDMLTRTLKGLLLSFWVGVIASFSSVIISIILGIMAGTLGRYVDAFISWLIDLFLSVPHLLALILISFALGGGFKGVVIGVALTHWPRLARLIRAEILQLRSSEYIQISKRLGKSNWWIARKHMMPHIVPQALVGFLLLFPHAILHEAGVTFLGMGLSSSQPAIGIILSESMRYLSAGMWWLALFPGLCLLLMVRMFDIIGENLRLMLHPHEARK
ncbi:peptide ABC transporter permease [Desulfuribacillus alkaliarsenatis]|uniref:Peptide ABC transporter permease n=1 Tax=Desulfuribacillus alkaliarsenatis TaxID=766136 RepID=A0A1E5G3L9_9FIRM|nr:peptide ABC transporter permease [Desulfuribacillus alkaliarsenatis]